MPPLVEVSSHDVLSGASFHVARAQVRWRHARHSVGWGRDRSLVTAAAKAVCEAVERFSFTRLPKARWTTGAALDNPIAPNSLVRYEAAQYTQPGFPARPFEHNVPKLWIRAEPVRRSAGAADVLADFVCSPAAFDADYRSGLVTHATSSGCASAYRLEDAVLRATLELVERDAFMRHWFAQRRGRPVAAASMPARFATRLKALEASGCAAGAQVLDRGAHPTWLVWAQHCGICFTSIGSATGLDGAAALEAAMNELETHALAHLEGVPARRIDPSDVKSPADHAALYATEAYFQRADALLSGPAEPIDFDGACAAFEATPDALFDRLERRGHALYWVDLSTDEALTASGGRPIHTVRALGTELIPISFGSGCLPLGMDRWQRVDPLVIHPFA